jgi:hypothetical protein
MLLVLQISVEIKFTSAALLVYQRLSGSPVIHAPKTPLWYHSKRVRRSPQSQVSNPGRCLNHWASVAPNHSESRWISLVAGFQSWPMSESLGLSGTQPQWEEGNLPGPGLPILADVWITGPQWHPTTVMHITLSKCRRRMEIQFMNIYELRPMIF